MSIEELKQALDVLIDRGQLSPDEFKEKKNEAITALRQAIAEAEKQPDWKSLVLNHNADCDARCNMDMCGYKPYYENNKRRCPNCPVYEKIEL